MLFADCVPIIFYETERKIAAITHAGWQGTVRKVVVNTIRKMVQEYSCKQKSIIACIGPSICVYHYPVGEKVMEALADIFTFEEVGFFDDGEYHLDLQASNKKLINESGVTQVYTSEICTAENTTDWFSHRAELGKTGRFAAVMTCKKYND